MATYDDFQKLDIRVGRITAAELLPDPKYTTHKLTIDFGTEIGQKVSGARVKLYKLEDLIGMQVIGVVNVPPRQIGKLVSQVLTLGLPDQNDDCILVTPEHTVPLGGRLY